MQVWIPILMLAFVLVSLSALLLTVLILYVMDFQSRGWSWVHGALFSAMIASTDAIAVPAMLKAGEWRVGAGQLVIGPASPQHCGGRVATHQAKWLEWRMGQVWQPQSCAMWAVGEQRAAVLSSRTREGKKTTNEGAEGLRMVWPPGDQLTQS